MRGKSAHAPASARHSTHELVTMALPDQGVTTALVHEAYLRLVDQREALRAQLCPYDWRRGRSRLDTRISGAASKRCSAARWSALRRSGGHSVMRYADRPTARSGPKPRRCSRRTWHRIAYIQHQLARIYLLSGPAGLRFSGLRNP